MVELHFPDPVKQEVEFFGRGNQRTEIKNVFLGRLKEQDRFPVALIGERRIGKTSLLINIKNWLDQNTSYAAVYQGSWLNREKFQQELLSALCTTVGWRLVDRDWVRWEQGDYYLTIQSTPDFVGACAQVCQTLGDRRVVVVIDEIDSLIKETEDHNGPEQVVEILALLQHLLERTSLPLDFLVTLTQTDILNRSYGSNFLHNSKQLRLEPFDYKETASMAQIIFNGFASFRSEALGLLYQMSGGHPFFAKAILDGLLEGKKVVTADITMEVLEGAIGKVVRNEETRNGFRKGVEVTETMKNLFAVHFSEADIQVLEYLAESEGPITANGWPDQLQQSAAELTRRGYLEQSNHQLYDFRIGLFRPWMQTHRPNYQASSQLFAGVEQFDFIPGPLPKPEPMPGRGEMTVRFLARKRRLYVGHKEIHLTALELRVVDCLFSRKGQVVSRDDLLQFGWKREYDAGIENAPLDRVISSIRRKLGDSGKAQKYIRTHSGIGYMAQNVYYDQEG